jgi:surface antigen/LysM repeat protein
MGKSDIRLFLNFLLILVKYFDLKLWKTLRFLTFYKKWTVRKLLWRRGRLFRPAVHFGIAVLALLAIVGGSVFGPLPSLATKSQAILPPAVAPQNTIKTEIPQNRPRSATVEHIVVAGETLSSLAARYSVSVDTIKWANNLSSDDIVPGEKLLVLPVTGVVHIAAKGETLNDVSNAHGVTTDAIINFPFNDIPDDKAISEGQIIVVPGGKPYDVVHPPAPKLAVVSSKTQVQTTSKVYSSLANSYPFGQCTYYVAARRHIPWLDNAGGWYRDAISAGFKVGHSPAPGAIMVSVEGNPLGHVSLVERVNSDGSWEVSEMNFRSNGGGWGRVDHRTVVSGTIYVIGFIY